MGQVSKELSQEQTRAEALGEVRSFFSSKGVLEVDTPLLSDYPPIDTHIDIFEVAMEGGKRGYLHSSPEYGMKKLLAQGSGDIYQLGHVFRKGETGPLHKREFTMIEWYRCNTTFDRFLEENLELCSLFLGNVPHEVLSYKEAFMTHLGLSYTSPQEELLRAAKKKGVELQQDPDLPNLLWGCCIEPNLGKDKLTIITHYPKEQAAFAKLITIEGEEVAERFEIYFKGIELGNGYHELTDPIEQEKRLLRWNQERKALGKEIFPIDPEFLDALKKGLPNCYGIALGFDRLLMLKLGGSIL